MDHRTAALAVTGTAAITELALIRLGTTYGSTPEERVASLPGDDIVPKPVVVTNHGITIDARLTLDLPAARSSGWLSNEASAGSGPVAAWIERGEQHRHQECPS